jgi:tripartite-type tricarboxylate transporter receptor subunit TctC
MDSIQRRLLTKGVALAVIVSGATLVTAEGAHAEDYPTRVVTIVSPFPAGATIDGTARMLAQKLAERLGKPFIIENRPGAGGVTAAVAVAKATPDGYTLLMGGSAVLALNPALRKELPYDPTKHFVPLALVAGGPFVLVVHPSLPVHSVPDLVKLAKEKPGQLSYASGGPGNPSHITAEMLKFMTGIDIVHVAYKGTAPALNDVVGGHVPVMLVDLLPALQLIAEGKVRALAVTSTTRAPSLPAIPTMVEAGVAGFNAVFWPMLVAPANTPAPIVNKLHAELAAILGTSEMQEWMVRNGMTPAGARSPEELSRFLNAELDRWRTVLEQIGLARSQ